MSSKKVDQSGTLVNNSGVSRGGAAPPLFLDGNEARRAEKKIFFGGHSRFIWDSFEIDCYTGYFPFRDGSIVSGVCSRNLQRLTRKVSCSYTR